jgi:flagellar basal-body rod protein FlgB
LSVPEFQKLLRTAIDSAAGPRSRPSQGYPGYGYDVQTQWTGEQRLRQVRDSLPSILRHDGGDVGLEQQVAEMSKNQTMHNLAISIMTSQFRLLQTAISERV